MKIFWLNYFKKYLSMRLFWNFFKIISSLIENLNLNPKIKFINFFSLANNGYPSKANIFLRKFNESCFSNRSIYVKIFKNFLESKFIYLISIIIHKLNRYFNIKKINLNLLYY